jgi:HEPN domain-containing protein
MPPRDSLYPQDWFRIAEKDLKRAEHLLSIDDPEGAGYHLQQSVEKYLKGFLLYKGWKLKRIHDLEVLLNDALNTKRHWKNTGVSVKRLRATTLLIDTLFHRRQR